MCRVGRVKDNAGFTLVEVLVTICLLSLLFGFFLQCFVFVMEQYRCRIALLELEENISIAIDLLETDLSQTIGVSACNHDSLTIQQMDGMIYYTLGTDTQSKDHFYDLTGKILYRRESTQWNRQPMANFISSFRVIYYDEDANPTEQASLVKSIEIQLEGIWNHTVIRRSQIIRLKDSHYF